MIYLSFAVFLLFYFCFDLLQVNFIFIGDGVLTAAKSNQR